MHDRMKNVFSKDISANSRAYAWDARMATGSGVSPPQSTNLPGWCQTLGCGPAPRPLPFGLNWHFRGLIALLRQKQEDNFLLFVIRYDEALEAAKNAAAKNTPAAKQAWLDKIDEACKFAQVAGMDKKNLALLRTELLGKFSDYKTHPWLPLRDHKSYLEWYRLALHYGMKPQANYFLFQARKGP